MKLIGEKLKQRRIELGYSINDLHEKTKLSQVHIKAIEEGNLDYFRHDLSYLKFFLQYYCQAVYLDYDEIEDEFKKTLNEYHETQLIKKQESHQASNENIQRRIQNNQKKYRKAHGEPRMQFDKIDHQTLIVVGIVLLIIAVLIFGLIKFVIPNLRDKPDETPVVETSPPAETPVVDQPEETPVIEVQPNTLTIVEESYDNYRISGINKNEMTFRIDFTSETWIDTYINDQSVDTPATDIYQADSFIEIPITDEINKITILFGNLAGSNISVNSTPVNLNQQAVASDGITINFYFGSE